MKEFFITLLNPPTSPHSAKPFGLHQTLYYCVTTNTENLDTFAFERLEVYTKSRAIVKEIYSLLTTLPPTEKYGLVSQMQRAIVSVPSNIAEGCSRMSFKDKIRFLEIAHGSLMEVYCQLQLCQDIGYLDPIIINEMRDKFFDISRMLTGLRNSYARRIE